MITDEQAHFRFSPQSNLKIVSQYWLIFPYWAALVAFFYFTEYRKDLHLFVWFAIYGYALPPFLLHTWYAIINYSVSIDIFYTREYFEYSKGDRKRKIEFKEIDRVEKFVSWKVDDNWARFPFNHYDFSVIYLKSGENLLITNLVSGDLGLGFKNKHFRYFNPPIFYKKLTNQSVDTTAVSAPR